MLQVGESVTNDGWCDFFVHVVYNGHKSVSELLLKGGADRRSMSSLYFFSALGNAEEVVLLLTEDSSGIDTPCEYMFQATPLHVAALNGNADVVRALLDAGSVAIDTKAGDGMTPLQIAMGMSQTRSNMGATVQLLLDRGTSKNAKESKEAESWAANGSNALYDKSGKSGVTGRPANSSTR